MQIVAIIAMLFAVSVVLAYTVGRHSQKSKEIKSIEDRIKKAREAADALHNDDVRAELRDKYFRDWLLPDIHADLSEQTGYGRNAFTNRRQQCHIRKVMQMNEEEIVLKDEERQPCEVWTRVMGYFRPSSCYNRGKLQEFNDRKYFSISKASERIKKGNLKENA